MVYRRRLGAHADMPLADVNGDDLNGLRAAAEEIGICAATLSRIESGCPPSLDVFRKLCLWGGWDANELLGLKK